MEEKGKETGRALVKARRRDLVKRGQSHCGCTGNSPGARGLPSLRRRQRTPLIYAMSVSGICPEASDGIMRESHLPGSERIRELSGGGSAGR